MSDWRGMPEPDPDFEDPGIPEKRQKPSTTARLLRGLADRWHIGFHCRGLHSGGGRSRHYVCRCRPEFCGVGPMKKYRKEIRRARSGKA